MYSAHGRVARPVTDQHVPITQDYLCQPPRACVAAKLMGEGLGGGIHRCCLSEISQPRSCRRYKGQILIAGRVVACLGQRVEVQHMQQTAPAYWLEY